MKPRERILASARGFPSLAGAVARQRRAQREGVKSGRTTEIAMVKANVLVEPSSNAWDKDGRTKPPREPGDTMTGRKALFHSSSSPRPWEARTLLNVAPVRFDDDMARLPPSR